MSLLKWVKNFRDRNTRFYPGGNKKSKGEFGYGEREGKWTYWYENGQKKAVGRYDSGVMVYDWVYWYENGQKKAEGKWVLVYYDDYHASAPDGKWTFWYENGKKKAECDWDGCTAGGEKCSYWDESGNVITDLSVLKKIEIDWPFTVEEWEGF